MQELSNKAIKKSGIYFTIQELNILSLILFIINLQFKEKKTKKYTHMIYNQLHPAHEEYNNDNSK